MLWYFKYDGYGHHGYHNKNRAVKGLKQENTKMVLSSLFHKKQQRQ